MSDPTDVRPSVGVDYLQVQESEPFRTLRKDHRSFVFPLAVVFLVWYFVYVLLAAFAPQFMAQRVWGDITVGLLFGLGQFVTTFAITMGYVAFANRRLDPQSASIRSTLEKAEVDA